MFYNLVTELLYEAFCKLFQIKVKSCYSCTSQWFSDEHTRNSAPLTGQFSLKKIYFCSYILIHCININI